MTVTSTRPDSATQTAGELTIRPDEFQKISRLAYQKFGLMLGKGKEDLVYSRLAKIIKGLNFQSFDDYFRHVTSDPQALIGMIDALSTNHTSFFREIEHFDFMEKHIFPGLRRSQAINIWSAACSTGEEPYSVAFWILEKLGMEIASRVHILATDISTKALDAAQKGVYAEERFSRLSYPWLNKYLLKGQDKWKGWYRVKPEVARVIEFQRLNLIEPFPFESKFDLILCRNVMIYFDRPTQEKLVNGFARRLVPDGHLFVGHAESLSGVNHPLKYVRPAIYQSAAGLASRLGG